MATGRGSKQKLKIIKESVFGTTPAMPTMLELPINVLNKDVAINLIRSGQIRTHPFVDRLMQGAQQNDLEINTELQGDTHDVLLELLCGAAWSSNVVKATDALVGSTIESEHNDLTLFDQFTGCCVRRGEFNFPAQADGVVTVNYGLMAKGGLLDEPATIATAVTAAGTPDPFVFHEATVEINAAERPVTSLSFTLERQVDPLYILGARQPDEYIPSDFTLTGTISIPLRDDTESAMLLGFTDAAINVACVKGSESRTFDIFKANYAGMGRRIQGRGAIIQEIRFEAKYSLSDTSIFKITRSA